MQKLKQYNEFCVKDRIEICLSGIPAVKQFYLNSIGDIQDNHINNLVLLQGTVIRTGQIKSVTVECQMKCNLCEAIQTVKIDLTDSMRLQQATQCQNMIEKSGKSNNFFRMLIQRHYGYKNNQKKQQNQTNQVKQKQCASSQFSVIDGTQRLQDFQEIKIQDMINNQDGGQNKRYMKIMLFGGQINMCRVGDNIIVGGIVIPVWIKIQKGSRPTIQLTLRSLQIQLKNFQDTNKFHINQDIQKFNIERLDDLRYNDFRNRQLLLSSTCNQVYQRYDIKLGILLCIVGGTSNQSENTQIRANSHMLLIGEPGTGKSSILKSISDICAKSIYTNGIGCTQAGLTVSYVKEGSEWIIEAGALVMADMGVCCIDEFNLIQKSQLNSILEALEQQTISVQKAGLAAKLNARTTLFAACNPLGPGQKYRHCFGLEENTGLSSPLLSRFDLVFILIDQVSEQSDLESTEFILSRYGKDGERQNNYEIPQISREELCYYLLRVKQEYSPCLGVDAHLLIQRYYMQLRSRHGNVNIRCLESLIRLSQAYAKLMQRSEVVEDDVLCILSLIECAGGLGLGIGRDLGLGLSFVEYIENLSLIKQNLA